MEIQLSSIISKLLADYFVLYPDWRQLPIEVIVSFNLSKSHLELRPDLAERLKKEKIESEDDSNGRMVPPHRVGEPMSILLNGEHIVRLTEDKTMAWVGTLAHEITHAIDYHQMALRENLDCYDPLLEARDYLMFQMWSEFHARRQGYTFLRDFFKLDEDDSTKNDRVEYVVKTELPLKIKHFFADYHDTDNAVLQINFTMQFLGRFSVWCDLFPETFNNSFIRAVFEANPWLYTIYSFLKQNTAFDDVYPKLNEMRQILLSNWSGI